MEVIRRDPIAGRASSLSLFVWSVLSSTYLFCYILFLYAIFSGDQWSFNSFSGSVMTVARDGVDLWWIQSQFHLYIPSWPDDTMILVSPWIKWNGSESCHHGRSQVQGTPRRGHTMAYHRMDGWFWCCYLAGRFALSLSTFIEYIVVNLVELDQLSVKRVVIDVIYVHGHGMNWTSYSILAAHSILYMAAYRRRTSVSFAYMPFLQSVHLFIFVHGGFLSWFLHGDMASLSIKYRSWTMHSQPCRLIFCRVNVHRTWHVVRGKLDYVADHIFLSYRYHYRVHRSWSSASRPFCQLFVFAYTPIEVHLIYLTRRQVDANASGDDDVEAMSAASNERFFGVAPHISLNAYMAAWYSRFFQFNLFVDVDLM